MIQAVIARLSNESFIVKGWAITVAGAFVGFAVGGSKWALSLVALIPSGLFWWLDMYFLRSERLFRHLYASVRDSEDVPPFFMEATSPDFVRRVRLRPGGAEAASQWRTFWRPTLRYFYGALILAALVTALFLGLFANPTATHMHRWR